MLLNADTAKLGLYFNFCLLKILDIALKTTHAKFQLFFIYEKFVSIGLKRTSFCDKQFLALSARWCSGLRTDR